MKKGTRRLQLKRETVRELDQAELSDAQSGIITLTILVTCTTTITL